MFGADDYVFFWKTNERNGWGSQWLASPFTAAVNIGGEAKMITFTSAEQWMMVQKALLFSDTEIAEEMLRVQETGGAAMAQIKALGRQVKGFDDERWTEARERIVLEGNLLKFRQNDELREQLLATGEKMLVEASPNDRIWGIGYREQEALGAKDSWGLNLLGKALVETRRRLVV